MTFVTLILKNCRNPAFFWTLAESARRC